jgi:uncharacterized membrane protein YbhN (UPF0104 family)
MTKTRTHQFSQLAPKKWLPAVFVVIGLYVVLPQLHIFRDSLQQLQHIVYDRLLVAFSAVALTFLLSAAVYKLLAFKRLPYGRTLVAEVAANFINRLLPAGLGGIGANYRYLRSQKHNSAQAASVVTANNGLGLIGHGLLVVMLVTLFHAHAVPFHMTSSLAYGLIIVAMVGLGLGLALPRLRRRLKQGLADLRVQMGSYRTRPSSVAAALVLQIFLTLSNVTAFWLCVLAVHASLSFVAALIVFTIGFGIGGATPTPGGIGGVEAGLVGGLVAYHMSSSIALAAVLLYRLISYWLPLIISGAAFAYAMRHHYFSKT